MQTDRDERRVTLTSSSHQSDRDIRRYGFGAAALVVGAIAVMMLIRDPARGPTGREPTGAASGVGTGTSGSVPSPHDPEVPNPNQTLQRQP